MGLDSWEAEINSLCTFLSKHKVFPSLIVEKIPAVNLALEKDRRISSQQGAAGVAALSSTLLGLKNELEIGLVLPKNVFFPMNHIIPDCGMHDIAIGLTGEMIK